MFYTNVDASCDKSFTVIAGNQKKTAARLCFKHSQLNALHHMQKYMHGTADLPAVDILNVIPHGSSNRAFHFQYRCR